MKKYLRYIGFFSGFSDEELDEFSAAADAFATKKEEFILKENEEGKGLYFIFDGQFDAVTLIEEQKYKILKKLGRGEFFGEMSLLTDDKNSASIISRDTGTLVFISKDAFFKLSENSPKLSLKIMKKLAVILSERLKHMNQKYEMAISQIYSK